MKKTLIVMAAAMIGLTSCQKDELTQPIINTVDTLNYTLDFRCDSLHINVTYLHTYRQTNMVASVLPNPSLVIGRVFYFGSSNKTNFTVWCKWDGTRGIDDVSGNINGHSFGDITFQPTNGTLNMCNYAQNVPYTFTLKNYKGEVVMTNASSALSK